MALSAWQKVLRLTEGAEDSYRQYVQGLLAVAQAKMDGAKTWDDFLEARGSKKTLDDLLASLTLTEREEQAYARFRTGTTSVQ